DDGNAAYSLEERISIQHKKLDIYNVLYENGDFGFFHGDVLAVHRQLSYLYSVKGDIPTALKHLELSVKHAIRFDTESNDKTLKHTSLLFRGIWQYGNYSCTSQENEENEASELLDDLQRPIFDKLRQYPEFAAAEEELRKAKGPRWK
ncbi:MAG: hypothetical protein FWC32_04500, partial [Firmicutes bacterium]|nr:hypothetical protein [Bacillota bacterium]